jgi:[ribosomal protein S5]-alanine N-acetyltransferase
MKARDYPRLRELGCRATEEWPEKDLLDALPVFELLIKMNGVDGFGSWVATDRGGDAVIGSLGFIGAPDEEGRVELGFGVVPSRRGLGYCTEAVGGMLEWLKGQGRARKVIAHCDLDNAESARVLAKSGFSRVGVKDGLATWERSND